MDMKNVLLNKDLFEEVYMQPLSGLSHPLNIIILHIRDIYIILLTAYRPHNNVEVHSLGDE
jgi:hypothetical protein